ncbi:DMT family transporter [Thioclava sp. FR2]|uniref:DMT family transporter n=1 Tax=Thioclava sp. FR2 TaxID=3445780 RepID=UPI003EB7F74F
MNETHRPIAAALWMTGSIASFTAMAIAARQIQGEHDTFEIMTIRSLIGFFLVLCVAGALGRLTEVKANRLAGHLGRNVVHFAGQNLWLLALTLIPLAQVFAIEFTSPIWVIVLSPFLLGEKITQTKVLAATMGFLGILIVARPDFGQINAGILAAFACAICFALTGIATKALTRAESIVSILFWLTLMQFVMGATLAAWDGNVRWPTAHSMPWLTLIGVCGLLAHLCLTSALRLAPASFVMPVDFARLPLIAGIGAVFYNEPIDVFVFIGAVLIISGNLINVRAEAKKRA